MLYQLSYAGLGSRGSMRVNPRDGHIHEFSIPVRGPRDSFSKNKCSRRLKLDRLENLAEEC